jgi:pyruvate,water dikinase
MLQNGFAVPNGFILTNLAYQYFLKTNNLTKDIKRFIEKRQEGTDGLLKLSKDIQEKILNSPIPADLANKVEYAYTAIGLPIVAVRSSALAEDTETASSAGQQDSFLGVRETNQILVAIQRVWASAWSPRAISYRMRDSDISRLPGIAVIIQELIFADAAGVAFTMDPLSGDTQKMLIDSSWGLGNIVVSGVQTPDRFVVDKLTGNIIRAEVSREKLYREVIINNEVKRIENGSGLRTTASINSDQLIKLVKIIKDIETYFKSPQDIEWAIYNNNIYVLQSRPIVGAKWFFDEGMTWTLLENNQRLSRVSFAEYLPNPLTPFFFSFQIPAIESAYQQVHAELGLRGFFRYPFVNVINDYLYLRVDVHFNPLIFIDFFLRTAPTLMRAPREFRSITLPLILNTKDRFSSLPIKELGINELIAATDELCKATASYWKTIAVSTWIWKLSEMLFAGGYKLLFRNTEIPYYHLLSGLPTTGWEATDTLYKIADKYRDVWKSHYQEYDSETLLRAIEDNEAGGEIREDLDRYAEEFGFQTLDFDFIAPTLGERRLRQIEAMMRYWSTSNDNKGNIPSDSVANQRFQAEVHILDYLKWLLPLQASFKWFLRFAQNMTLLREDMNYYLSLLSPIVRTIALELGLRLKASGKIENVDDIFFVTKNEILRTTSESIANGSLISLVADRKKRRNALSKIAPPHTVPEARSTRSIIQLIFRWLYPEARINKQDSHKIIGIPASRGMITAPVCVIRSADDFNKFNRGSILVAPTTSPAWTPILAIAGGIITDQGGPLSHASIIAREFGIPAVLGTQVATRVLNDGQIVTLDGNHGIVEIMENNDGS